MCFLTWDPRHSPFAQISMETVHFDDENELIKSFWFFPFSELQFFVSLNFFASLKWRIFVSVEQAPKKQLAIVISIYLMVARKQIFYEFKGKLRIRLRLKLLKAIIYFVWKITHIEATQSHLIFLKMFLFHTIFDYTNIQ